MPLLLPTRQHLSRPAPWLHLPLYTLLLQLYVTWSGARRAGEPAYIQRGAPTRPPVVRRVSSHQHSTSTLANLTFAMADTEVAPQVNYFALQQSSTSVVGPESDFEANLVLQTMAEWLEATLLLEVSFRHRRTV